MRLEDANGAVSGFEYDGANNTTAQIDALGRRTEYGYSVRNERVLKRYPTVASITVAETSTYDEAGNRISFVDGNGASHTYTYDVLNRLTDLTYTPGAGSAAVNNAPGEVGSILTEHREYDANNNLTQIREVYATATAQEERTSARTYDRFDRLLTTTDTFGHTTGYQYDLNGNRVQLTDSDGINTRSRFDALNRTVSVSTTFGETQYHYDRSSRRTGVTYPNGTQGVMGYDQVGRQLEMVYSQSSATVLRYLYRYDENGNRVEQVEENGTDEEVTQYGYDANDRLETIGYNLTGCSQVPNCTDGTPEESVTYTYDAAYNRLSEQVRDNANTLTENKTYTYNARNQMTRIDDSVSGDVITYVYDGRGARIRKDKTANNVTESERYIRDVRGHLRETIKDAVTTGKYVYDWQGLRVEKIGERGVERSVYDDQSVLQHKDQTGITTAKWDYGSGQLLSMKPQSEPTQVYLTDSLGSVAALTNESGAVQKRTSYDAWGMKRREVGSSYNRFGFTGYEEDRETGLYYAKARYYDPDDPVFLSQDAWEGDPNIAPSLHKYLYVYQNPTVFTDPTGNCPSGQIGVVGESSASCRDMTFGEKHPIIGSILGDGVALFNRREGTAHNPITNTSLSRGQELNVKVNILGSLAPASKAPALAGPVSSFVSKQASKVKKTVEPFIQVGKEKVGALAEKVKGVVLPEGGNPQFGNARFGSPDKTKEIIESATDLVPTVESRQDTEVFFRTVSEEHFEKLKETGKLPGTGETSTSPTREFAENYRGVTVEFHVKSGTTKKLEEIGVGDGTPNTLDQFPKIRTKEVGVPWNKENVRFKSEPHPENPSEKVVNIQLGKGKGLDTFNDNIVEFNEVSRRNSHISATQKNSDSIEGNIVDSEIQNDK